jgi:hypothetical protein
VYKINEADLKKEKVVRIAEGLHAGYGSGAGCSFIFLILIGFFTSIYLDDKTSPSSSAREVFITACTILTFLWVLFMALGTEIFYSESSRFRFIVKRTPEGKSILELMKLREEHPNQKVRIEAMMERLWQEANHKYCEVIPLPSTEEIAFEAETKALIEKEEEDEVTAILQGYQEVYLPFQDTQQSIEGKRS